ncbi:MAG: glycine oxidase ThiO [Pseudomonadota bacterium]
MKIYADNVIIGGGIIGLLTAFYLSKSNQSIVIIEKSALASEASWAGGGIISPLYPWRYSSAVTALASQAQEIYPSLVEELYEKTGIDAEYLKSGLLISEIDDWDQAINWCEKHCIKSELVKKVNTNLKMRSSSWLYLPEVSQLRNPRLVASLSTYLRSLEKVKIIENDKVQRVDFKNVLVKSQRHQVVAKKIIFTTGAWTSNFINIPIKPIRGEMLMFAPFKHSLKQITLVDGKYIIPRRDGRVIVGSTLEDVGYKKGPTAVGRKELLKAAVNIMPMLKYQKIERHWAGLRPCSPNGIPFIGFHPDSENVLVNAGHYRNGVVLAPASCQLAVDLLLNAKPKVDHNPYHILSTRTYSKEKTKELAHRSSAVAS